MMMPKVWRQLQLAALVFVQAGLITIPAAAELRLLSQQPEYQRLLSIDDHAAGTSQVALATAIEHFKAGRHEDCRKALQEAAGQTPALPPADVMFARMFLRTGNDAEALRRLDRLSVELPLEPEVFISLGELALRQGRLTDAWLQFEWGAALKPPTTWSASRLRAFRAELAQLQGETAERRADWLAAECIYRSWSEMDRTSAPAVLGHGRSRLAQNQPEQALALFRKARQLDDQVPVAEVLLALIYARRGATDLAAIWFEKALADPDVTTTVRLEYCRWLLDQERPEDAIVQLASVPDTKESDTQRLYLKGLAARCVGDLDAAETAFSTLQQANPVDWAVSNQLALVLVERTEEIKRIRASQLAESNLRQSPDRATALATAGWIHFRLGNLASAEQLLHKALQTGGATPAAQFYLSRLLMARGQTPEAERWLQQSLDDPANWPDRVIFRSRQASHLLAPTASRRTP